MCYVESFSHSYHLMLLNINELYTSLKAKIISIEMASQVKILGRQKI